MDSRRNFLKKTFTLTAAACAYGALGTLPVACTSLRQLGYREEGNEMVIDKTAMADVSHAMVNHPQLRAPVYLRKSEQGYSALLMLCTHKGCDVKAAGAILHCPCHGSEFSQSGAVLKGPATDPLVQFPVRTDDRHIYVQIR